MHLVRIVRLRAGEIIPEVEGTRLWGPSRKRVPKSLKGPKTTYTTIAVAEKQSKRSKKGPLLLYIGSPGLTQEMELMGPGGEGSSRSTPVSLAMLFVGKFASILYNIRRAFHRLVGSRPVVRARVRDAAVLDIYESCDGYDLGSVAAAVGS